MSGTLQSWLALAFFLALCAGAAGFGVMFRPGAWYGELVKPGWTPPNWLFPPVWTLLYIAIAVAGWLVWRAAPTSSAMALWAAQLLFNAVWSWLFFGLNRIGLGFADIVLLWICIAGFVIAAWPVSTTASLLFVPYWIWVSYAGALNFAVWRLNG